MRRARGSIKLHSRMTVVLVTLLTGIANADVNLRISDDQTFRRPNAWSEAPQDETMLYAEATGPVSRPGVSIAWRNANQIEEVEVRIQNLGDEPGQGRVFVDVLDHTGKVLLHLEPPDELKVVRVPAFDRGGREGKILRMKASWELNTLIDRFDLTRTQYGVRATVETVGEDTDWTDNSKVKEWNIPFRVRPGTISSYPYVFKNHGRESIRGRWSLEHTPLPDGWHLERAPQDDDSIVLEPGEEVRGTLLLHVSDSPREGDFLELRLSVVDAETNRVVQQHEWFQVYDIVPPHVSNYRAMILQDHTIAIQALVADQHSGVLEATGVSTEFSVDGGRTWARKAHNYKVGNFLRPTLFETVIGPFAPNTKVLVRFTALDTAGNSATTIPDDATAFIAPPNAERLLEMAYIFPRTEKNPVFDVEHWRELSELANTLADAGIDARRLATMPISELKLSEERVASFGLGDSRRTAQLVTDLSLIQDLGIDFTRAEDVPIRRVKAIGQGIVDLTTLEFVVP